LAADCLCFQIVERELIEKLAFNIMERERRNWIEGWELVKKAIAKGAVIDAFSDDECLF
jgi:hypothetical protein